MPQGIRELGWLCSSNQNTIALTHYSLMVEGFIEPDKHHDTENRRKAEVFSFRVPSVSEEAGGPTPFCPLPHLPSQSQNFPLLRRATHLQTRYYKCPWAVISVKWAACSFAYSIHALSLHKKYSDVNPKRLCKRSLIKYICRL